MKYFYLRFIALLIWLIIMILNLYINGPGYTSTICAFIGGLSTVFTFETYSIEKRIGGQ